MTLTLDERSAGTRVEQAAHRRDGTNVDGATMGRKITNTVTRVLWRATEVPAAAWLSIAYPVIGISLWLGIGYASAGSHVSVNHTWEHVLPYGGAGVRVHGWIMIALALALFWCAAAWDRRPAVRLWVLRVYRTYLLVIACLWIASWFSYGFTWGAPAWWILLATLTTWLSRFTPTAPAGSTSRHHRDRRE